MTAENRGPDASGVQWMGYEINWLTFVRKAGSYVVDVGDKRSESNSNSNQNESDNAERNCQ